MFYQSAPLWGIRVSQEERTWVLAMPILRTVTAVIRITVVGWVVATVECNPVEEAIHLSNARTIITVGCIRASGLRA